MKLLPPPLMCVLCRTAAIFNFHCHRSGHLHHCHAISIVKIMVRTTCLGRALGRVIGRALGREVNCDSDEAPQRQRPTTLIRRQREATLVTKDVHHVDDAADEVHEQPQEATVDDEVVDAQGFSGRPHDTSVLTVYVDHVAVIVWNGEECPELKLSSHERKVQKSGRPTTMIEKLVVVVGLREVTITLDDVASLLHFPITGAFHSFETLHVDEAVLLLVELLKVSAYEARAARAYLLHLLGCTLFANKSATHAHVVFLDTFQDLTQSGSYAWGAIALVHIDHRVVREFELISLFFGYIRWGPVVIHRPERIVRQFGYVQTIPLHSLGSRLCLEDIDDIYMHFSDYLALVDEICVVLGQCTSDYIN
ncbi:Protein MAIN-LIKE 1 [Glycine soja]